MRLTRKPISRLPLAALLLLGGLLFAQTPNAPIVNFKLPLFNDDGYRTGYLKGDQGVYLSSEPVEIRILGMELSQYSGDERDAIIGSLKSPEAFFHYEKSGRSRAAGPGAITLENATFRLSGEDWVWQEKNNQIVINKNVRIVLSDQIGTLIK